MTRALMNAGAEVEPVSGITAIGDYLRDHAALPWVRVRGPLASFGGVLSLFRDFLAHPSELPVLGPNGNLGTAAVLCIAVELAGLTEGLNPPIPEVVPGPDLGGMRSLARYIASRLSAETADLPDLPVPAEFGQVFRDWAANRVSFVTMTRARPVSPETGPRSG